MTPHDPQALFVAVGTQLETTGRPVGLGKAPNAAAKPYVVLEPLTESFDGALVDPSEIDLVLFHVKNVGAVMGEAQWMQHESRKVLAGFQPTVSGVDVGQVRLVASIPQGQDPDGDAFTVLDRYEVFTSV